jgi:hypothetical protein
MIDVETWKKREEAAGRSFNLFFNNPSAIKASYSKILSFDESRIFGSSI